MVKRCAGLACQLARLARLAFVRLALSFALTFALVSLVRVVVCQFTGAIFGVKYVFALAVCVWIALRSLEVIRLTMPMEFARCSWWVNVIHWVAMMIFVLAILALLDGIFA
jgi:hypothetical protein